MNHKPLKQLYFKVDMTLCTGCKTCMIACRDKNDEHDVFFRRVVEYVGGGWTAEENTYRQNIFAYYLSVACNHCADPICVESCPTTAMHKLDNGIVIIDPNLPMPCFHVKTPTRY
jgi:anaerobic dimethyl sulfoxide reductase subunit B (iron-sulfur subunit)